MGPRFLSSSASRSLGEFVNPQKHDRYSDQPRGQKQPNENQTQASEFRVFLLARRFVYRVWQPLLHGKLLPQLRLQLEQRARGLTKITVGDQNRRVVSRGSPGHKALAGTN
jgi:hypothetical protein